MGAVRLMYCVRERTGHNTCSLTALDSVWVGGQKAFQFMVLDLKEILVSLGIKEGHTVVSHKG